MHLFTINTALLGFFLTEYELLAHKLFLYLQMLNTIKYLVLKVIVIYYYKFLLYLHKITKLLKEVPITSQRIVKIFEVVLQNAYNTD